MKLRQSKKQGLEKKLWSKKTKATEITEPLPEPVKEPANEAAPEESEVSQNVAELVVNEPVETELEKPDLFGRVSQLKGPRRKTGSTAKPPSNEPEFSTENQQFGRKSRKKNPK